MDCDKQVLDVYKHIKRSHGEVVPLIKYKSNYVTFGTDALFIAKKLGIGIDGKEDNVKCILSKIQFRKVIYSINRWGLRVAVADNF